MDDYVRRIRENIACDPENPRYRKTVRGAGYPFDSDREIPFALDSVNDAIQRATSKCSVTLDMERYFCKYRNMATMQARKTAEQVRKYADMFSAMGTEPRLHIMQLLLSAHPEGLVVGDIQEELEIPNSTLSHHLDKLRNEDLVRVRRESTFLRYTANTETLQELLQFLYAECCTRNKAVKPQNIVQICK